MKTIEIGSYGEDIAVKYLKKNGYRIIARNKHLSHNELDIIAVNREYIVFVEVKTRSTQKDLYSAYGSPASAVDKNKQMRTIQAARQYLSLQKKTEKQPRFDVVEVYIEKDNGNVLKINHITNAFGIN